MVEPLFKFEFATAPEVGQVLLLEGAEGKHAASVRRMRVGEAVVLCDGRGVKAHGEVSQVLSKGISVTVERVSTEPPPEVRLRLVQALAKGDRDELAIQAATELGVSLVTPWQADRSVSRWDASKATKGRERWQSICDEAAKQSLRAHFPSVEAVVTSGELSAAIEQGLFGQVIVLDPTADQGLATALESLATSELTFIVGPEGGLSPAELEGFTRARAIRVHMGADILRTSTAGLVALAVTNAKLGIYR